MVKYKKLIIACDGESASGKSTAAKLISKKYNLLLINSGLLYRYCSKIVIKEKPKNIIFFLKKKLTKISYKEIAKQKLHSEEISNHVAILAKNKKVREIVNQFQMKFIMMNNRICVEGRDIARVCLSMARETMECHLENCDEIVKVSLSMASETLASHLDAMIA